MWRAADLVREHRGDGHLAAGIAAGLTPVEMNVMTELWVGYPLRGYKPTRAYGPEAVDQGIEGLRARGWLVGGEVSATGLKGRDDIESATDASPEELVTALGDDLQWVVGAASVLSTRVVDAGLFTSDERKRAAG